MNANAAPSEAKSSSDKSFDKMTAYSVGKNVPLNNAAELEAALRHIGDGLVWGPAGFFEQDGTPVSTCSRGTLRRVETLLGEAGIEAAIGHEIEFVLVGPDGARLPSTLWAQYGLAGVLEHETFVRDVLAAAATSGVGIEQFHPEYGANQFEISLSPLPPVAAADQLVLTRIIIGRAARRHGLRVSLSPVPFAGSVGSGAHQHFSLVTPEGPLFSDGTGAAEDHRPRFVDHGAPGDDHQMIDCRLYLGEQVRGEQHRPAALGELAQQPPHPEDALRVEAVGGLVEDQHLRVPDQRLRQPQALAHAQ